MRWTTFLSSFALSATAVTAGRSLADVKNLAKFQRPQNGKVNDGQLFSRQESKSRYLTEKTSKFSVNGSAIPDVDFDVGESYAGQLPISSNATDESKLYFWFFPTASEEPSAQQDIVIWLNGGPGCSSLEGFLQENGPFSWQYGTFKPVANPWSWHRLANMIWIEQPVGTGFSTGLVTAENEDDVATQFMGFWKNFVDTFDIQGYNVYIAGESYAGLYCPYIASHMLDTNDTKYFDVKGMLIYDPVLTKDEVQEPIPAVHFVDYWKGLHPFNDSFTDHIHNVSADCGYTQFVEKYLVYPPAGQQPDKLPGTDDDGVTLDKCWQLYENIIEASLALNPCWDIYQVATTCPILWDVLGFPGTFGYLPKGASIYFDREEVKKAINAPLDVVWEECASGDVFVDKDTSPPSGLTVLPSVIDRTKNVIISHGALDFVLIANGTLLAIQNMTWGGKLGFQSKPIEPFYVPWHETGDLSSVAGQGVLGTTHTERGLTYVAVDIAGHMVPQYAPSAAFRHLEFLLGRVESLSGKEPFTIEASYPQSDAPLGLGTAPQGWSDKPRTCESARRRVR